MEHVILVNPISGNHKGVKFCKIVQNILIKNGITPKLFVSEYPKNLTKISRKISHKCNCRFYVLGGDGTLNEVISGIIGTNSEIVVIPCGTGNDFIKNISDYKSVRKIVIESLKNKSSMVDVMRVNDTKYCINILNAGFDAMVAKNVDNFRIFRFLSGKAKYNLSIFYTLLSNKNYKLKIRLDGKYIKKGYFTLVAISNGKFYGGGICPCPNAVINDELLDVCVIDSTRIREKIFLLPKYKKGNHITLNKAHISKTHNLTIVSTKKFPVSLDGEIIYTDKLKVELLPQKVNIVMTKKQ